MWQRSLLNRAGNLLEIASFLAIASILFGLLGKWHFLPDLSSHFRIQATVALLCVAIPLHLLRRRRWSVVSMIAGILAGVTLLPFIWPNRSRVPPQYRLVTMNVLTNNPRKELVAEYLIKADPDFVVLLETDAEWIEAMDKALSATWPHQRSIPRFDNFGLAIYSKLPWTACESIEFDNGLPTPSLTADFRLPTGHRFRLVATHPIPPMDTLRWESRNTLFAHLAEDVQSQIPETTVVAGDFNCSPWSYWFARLQRESGLKTSAYGHGTNISWYPIPIPTFGLPIDHVLVGRNIGVSRSAIGPPLGSDHRPVIVDFNLLE